MDCGSYFQTVSQVYESWEIIKRIPKYEEIVGMALFDRMFQIAPEDWSLFPWTREDFKQKNPKFLAFAAKFVRMLDLAVHMLGPDMEVVEEQMYDLGRSHKNYGVLPRHFDLMGQSLLYTLQGLLGSKFTPNTQKAWKNVYGFWSSTMIQGAVGL
ncbi:Involved in oxygen transport in the brain. Hexacoordinate globin [Seminavis robusta]|uniref:Involved in oxygen transport in the brain. Hexacoordinate globin n=1 Tax=Seminavis robusta TaxID=568900 RepID=A0A9N8HM97_9STRA|nr:Involved in oxygen transport in the brain. Hexacoordinate globin [Seminavis robusta]|eukprot:Sro879_g214890.1 Involved in oxygen transport in the brain. Hexacoordinate globin (155) ;mRNA; f:31838-32644